MFYSAFLCLSVCLFVSNFTWNYLYENFTKDQGRIIHCAGCTMGGGAPSQEGPRRSAAKFLPRCFDVWTFSVRLNVTTTLKKVVNFF